MVGVNTPRGRGQYVDTKEEKKIDRNKLLRLVVFFPHSHLKCFVVVPTLIFPLWSANGKKKNSYGAGVRLYEIKNGGDTAVGFGHDGLGGSSGACVPSEQLSIAMMVNGLSVMDPHSTRVVDCVFDVLKIGKLESNEGAIEMDIQTLATVKEVFSIA